MATLMTQLEAVNVMLATKGEAPVTSLSSGLPDAATCLEILNEVATTVQSETWHFNSEENYQLSPSPTDGTLTIPENAIQVDACGESESMDITIRGVRVYDRRNQTYVFTKPIKVKMTLVLCWDELPQAARQYIKIRAALIFQDRNLGSQELHQFTAEDELKAQTALKRFDAGSSTFNMLNDNISVNRTISR